jgi:hypothetical protein
MTGMTNDQIEKIFDTTTLHLKNAILSAVLSAREDHPDSDGELLTTISVCTLEFALKTSLIFVPEVSDLMSSIDSITNYLVTEDEDVVEARKALAELKTKLSSN